MIKKGQTFVVTTGEYSDYHVLSLCVAERDVSAGEFETLKVEYLTAHPEQGERYYFDQSMFVAFLEWRHVLKEVQAPHWGELHLDDCSIDESRFTDGWRFMPNQGSD